MGLIKLCEQETIQLSGKSHTQTQVIALENSNKKLSPARDGPAKLLLGRGCASCSRQSVWTSGRAVEFGA